jgi:hypothetical protein
VVKSPLPPGYYRNSETAALALADEFNRLRAGSAAVQRADLLDGGAAVFRQGRRLYYRSNHRGGRRPQHLARDRLGTAAPPRQTAAP